MVGFYLSCGMLLAAAVPLGEHQPAAAPSDSKPPVTRRFHEISRELSALLRQEAQPKNADQWAATVVRMTELYCEIMRDPRLPTSDTLEGYRRKLRSRLLKTRKQLQAELKRAAKGRLAVADSSETKLQTSVRRLARLAPPHDAGHSRAPGSLENRTGSRGRSPSGRGGAARADYGSALVELIYRTISPEFWDVRGGPGSIVYYQPWHALVVRATPEIHERIGGIADGLRDKK